MIYTNSTSSFPDQVVSEEIKSSFEYGLQVGRAIEGEWFAAGRTNNRFSTYFNDFHTRRLYARGEQSIKKYKDEMSIDGDLSYLNLDWKPVPIIPKFVDILVNGISQRGYEINAYAQDPESINKRTRYAQGLLRDINAETFLSKVQQATGMNLFSMKDREKAPQDTSELEVHMQLDYKQSIEVAEEELINNVLAKNKYDLTETRINHDLTVLGIAAVKTAWNKSEGIVVDYVDPARLIYSYTEDPNFEDLWYAGEIKFISLADLKKQFPNLTDADLEEIEKYPGNSDYTPGWNGRYDENAIQVLYFEYKTYQDQVFKIKQTPSGLEKALEKPDTFMPPPNDGFERVSRSIEVLYSGAKIVGHNKMLGWNLSENMTRPTSNLVKVNMSYNICAPRMYRGRIESTVSRITGFADMIQLTHLKLQQVLSRVVPDGVYLDVDGLAEVDLGNGTNYNPREALNMYFQTGSIVGRSLTQDGDMNPGKVPIQELNSSSGQAKIQSLIQTYQYYLQMIRDVTGLNEARDGSMPDKQSLVGLQKLAAANSNVATRHILQAGMYLTLKTCENITLRAADSLMYPLTKQALESSISKFNVGTLDELINLNTHDFGIFLQLEPDEEQKAMLEQNIQIALKSGQIYLEDAIDIREVKNIQLANAVLKQRRKRKQAQDQQAQQANIQAQANANAEAAERSALAETQKQQVISEQNINYEQAKNQFSIDKMMQEAEVEKEKMKIKFGYDMQLKQMDLQEIASREKFIEDRKDKRTKIVGTQQSQMIDQRQNDLLPTNFEQDGDNPMEGLV